MAGALFHFSVCCSRRRRRRHRPRCNGAHIEGLNVRSTARTARQTGAAVNPCLSFSCHRRCHACGVVLGDGMPPLQQHIKTCAAVKTLQDFV